jgi:Ras-related C3 botulinum toxin substrate 1
MDLSDDKETVKSENSDKRPAFVSYNQGLAMANKVGAVKYVECSAKTHKGLRSVFDEAVRAVMIPIHPKKKSRQCHLL